MYKLYRCHPCNLEKEVAYPALANDTQAKAAGVAIPPTLTCPSCKESMALHEPAIGFTVGYLCACGRTTEFEIPTRKGVLDTLPSPCCSGKQAKRIFGRGDAPAVSRQGSPHASVDMVIGKDADKRWTAIHEQQSQRDKVRKETNKVGLKGSEFSGYTPITAADRQNRATAYSNLESPTNRT